jgi:hypothetical protein
MATLEEAKRCPKCEQPGEEGQLVSREANGSRNVQIWCRNKRCKWFNTAWTITIRSDGSVPDPQDHSGKAKQYVGFEEHDRMAKLVTEAIKADEARAVEGGEIPYRGR